MSNIKIKSTVNSSQILYQMYGFFHLERANYADKLAGQTPLYYAARRGHLSMCKLLI